MRVASAPLSRSVLVKGLQHPSPLVQYTTLNTLLKVLQSLNAVVHDVQAAVETVCRQTPSQTDVSPAATQTLPFLQFLPEQHHLTGMSHGQDQLTTDEYLQQYAASRAAVFEQAQQQQDLLSDGASHTREASVLAQWQSFSDELQQALRARLPDPQSLIALLASLQRCKDSVSAADVSNMPGVAVSSGTAGKAGAASIAGIASPAGTTGTASPAGTAGNANATSKGVIAPEGSSASNSGSDNDLHSVVNTQHFQQALTEEFEDGGRHQPITASELTGTLLLKVLQKYQECFAEALSDGHVDVLSLMPQVCFACYHCRLC